MFIVQKLCCIYIIYYDLSQVYNGYTIHVVYNPGIHGQTLKENQNAEPEKIVILDHIGLIMSNY